MCELIEQKRERGISIIEASDMFNINYYEARQLFKRINEHKLAVVQCIGKGRINEQRCVYIYL